MGSVLGWTEYPISVSIPEVLIAVKNLGIFLLKNAGWFLSDQPQMLRCAHVL